MSPRSIDAPRRTVVIESIEPAVDCGRYPVKREVGDVLEVTADIFKDGHDVLLAYLRYRRDGDRVWQETPMRHVDNDRWAGAFALAASGRYHYTIEALTDTFRSWLVDLEKRHAGGQDLASALGEGLAMIRAAASRATVDADRTALGRHAERIERAASPAEAVAVSAEPELTAMMTRHLDRGEATRAECEHEVVVEPERARFAAWYEFFPRSGTASDRSATFKEAEAQLTRAAAMGQRVGRGRR